MAAAGDEQVDRVERRRRHPDQSRPRRPPRLVPSADHWRLSELGHYCCAHHVTAPHTPGVAAEVAARNTAFAALAEPDLLAMGWPEARAAARLVIAMSAELAMDEMADGKRDERGRETLWALLARLDLNADPAAATVN
ncbi:hypothetical protein [Streptacidiphilus sp. EB103A]|uniref:hypothetical protein n=1 Tax=Streptacidiphilus sp. EB103A TaxID=3156275 RepID=UPI003518B1EB